MKKIIIMAAALLLGLQGMNAQTENEENDDIITVTDKDGKSEEIEIPEGMEDNLDSLLHLQYTDISHAGYFLQLSGHQSRIR